MYTQYIVWNIHTQNTHINTHTHTHTHAHTHTHTHTPKHTHTYLLAQRTANSLSEW